MDINDEFNIAISEKNDNKILNFNLYLLNYEKIILNKEYSYLKPIIEVFSDSDIINEATLLKELKKVQNPIKYIGLILFYYQSDYHKNNKINLYLRYAFKNKYLYSDYYLSQLYFLANKKYFDKKIIYSKYKYFNCLLYHSEISNIKYQFKNYLYNKIYHKTYRYGNYYIYILF